VVPTAHSIVACVPARSCHRAKWAFTLVELLVVMAIIALLSALLLPALAGSKAKSRAIECLNNLRQWGLSYRMYADDNGDFIPRRGQGVQVLSQIDRSEDWFNALPPYFRSPTFQRLVVSGNRPAARARSLFICPAATDPGAPYFLPYGMNMNLSTWFLPNATKFAEVARPDCVVALADAPGPYASTYPSAKPYGVVARHSGRAALLFLAGQAQVFRGDYVGCGAGDPGREDVRWLTGTASDSQAHNY
jgi:prepilin-type N-terminal cleavage/methylation domain-containing protein